MWGMLSGASFGLIPLFTLPLFASGLTTDTILFYRFGVATLIIGLVQLIRGESFRVTSAEIVKLAILGLLYMSSALLLLKGYEYMAAGVATTIHFLYPVCTVLVMMIFFGEKVSLVNIGAVMLAITGVALLSSGEGGGGKSSASSVGFIVVVISALAYALYIIGIKRLRISSLSGFSMTFYVMLITAVLFMVKSLVSSGEIAVIEQGGDILNITLLALIPTVLSNFALVNAVKIVGSTTSSILGALEPLTAVIVGVSLFNEPISIILIIGITLIISAVTTIILRK